MGVKRSNNFIMIMVKRSLNTCMWGADLSTVTITKQLIQLFIILSEESKALEKVWILGDNFVAETYRKNFKKATGEFFLKEQYDVLPFCSSRYNDRNSNMLSQIQHSFTTALNSKNYLPADVIVFLDDDLIEYLQYKKFKVASLYGHWLEYIAKVLHEMLLKKLQLLPVKAQPKDDLQIYWIEPANHKNFALENVRSRETFAACMDMVIKEYDNMQLLKIKEFWNKNDHDLVMNN